MRAALEDALLTDAESAGGEFAWQKLPDVCPAETPTCSRSLRAHKLGSRVMQNNFILANHVPPGPKVIADPPAWGVQKLGTISFL